MSEVVIDGGSAHHSLCNFLPYTYNFLLLFPVRSCTKYDTILPMKTANKVGSLFLRCNLLRMKELGVSQTELAKRMNASRPYVVKVLHGDVNITLGSAARFAKALQLDFFPDLRDENGESYTVSEVAVSES